MVVEEVQFLSSRARFARSFWLVNYVQFAAIAVLYMYGLNITGQSCRDALALAEEAMKAFPRGVEGDRVGQRYLTVLDELRQLCTLRPTPAFSLGEEVVRTSLPSASPIIDSALGPFSSARGSEPAGDVETPFNNGVTVNSEGIDYEDNDWFNTMFIDAFGFGAP